MTQRGSARVKITEVFDRRLLSYLGNKKLFPPRSLVGSGTAQINFSVKPAILIGNLLPSIAFLPDGFDKLQEILYSFFKLQKWVTVRNPALSLETLLDMEENGCSQCGSFCSPAVGGRHENA